LPKVVVMPKTDIMSEDAVFIRWLKNVGDKVETGEPLFLIETGKAALEIESLYKGVLLEKIAKPGQELKIGEPVGILGEKGENYDKNKLFGKSE